MVPGVPVLPRDVLSGLVGYLQVDQRGDPDATLSKNNVWNECVGAGEVERSTTVMSVIFININSA